MGKAILKMKPVLAKQYALYNGDSCQVLPNIPSESVGFVVYSPPFCQLFSYSDSLEDLGNNKSYSEFFEHYRFIVQETFRTLLPGRNVAVHCMDLPTFKRNGDEMGLIDFPGDIIKLHQECGFTYHSRHCIWKDPLVAATRTKALGLAHKQICKDSVQCRTGIADTIVCFRKPGDNPIPIKHPRGLSKYPGLRPIPRELDRFIAMQEPGTPQNPNPYDGRLDKRSHWIWQQLASPVWFDIDQTKVLPYKEGREKDDQKHICALQLNVIDRCLTLWAAQDDVVLSPFLGVGSEIYCAIRYGCKGIGIELKSSYFRQACRNVRSALKKSEDGFHSNGDE